MSASRRLSSRAGLVAAALGMVLMTAPAAHAFTFQDSDGSTVAPRQGYLDLDTRPATDNPASRFGNEGTTTLKQGGMTLQFGRQPSFNEQYRTDHYFDPLGKPPGVR